jgi:hypothetical protein
LIRGIPLLILLVLTGNLLWFTWSVDNGVIRHDYWRMVHLIDLYSENSLTFEEVIAQSNGLLKSPFTVILPLLDGLFFDLELKGIHLAAILMRLLAAALALTAFGLRSRREEHLLSSLAMSAGAFVMLSPALFAMLGHGQASISIIRSSFYVIFFGFLATYLTSSKPRSAATVLVSCALAFLVFFVAGSYAVAFAGTVLAVFTLGVALNLFDTRVKRRNILIIFGTFMVSCLAVAGLLWKPTASAYGGAIVTDPLSAILFFLSTLGNSLLSTEIARTVPATSLLIVGIACLGLLAFGLVRSSTRTPTSQTLLGWQLVLYSLGAISLITIGRTTSGSPIAARYLSDSMLWQVGLLLLLSARPGTNSESRFGLYARKTLLVAFIATIISCQMLAADHQWKLAPALKRGFERRAAVIQVAESLDDKTLERRLREPKRLHRHYIRHAIDILREHRLNVFRPPNQPEPNATQAPD